MEQFYSISMLAQIMDDFDNVQCQQIILTQYKLSDGERGGLIFDNKKTFSCLCTAFVLYLCTAAKTVIKVKQVLISKITFLSHSVYFPLQFFQKGSAAKNKT